MTRCPHSVMLRSELQTVAPHRVVWVLGPPATIVRAAWESVHRTTGPVARSPATVLTSSSAARIAMRSARVLERRLPGATRISRLSPDLMMTSAPTFPRETPLSAEPSLQIQVESIVDSESIQRAGCSDRTLSTGAAARGGAPAACSCSDVLLNGDVTHVGEVQRLRAQPVPASGGGEAPQRVQLSDQTERFIWREGQH